jgi:hypothetical protein
MSGADDADIMTSTVRTGSGDEPVQLRSGSLPSGTGFVREL